jgi:multiple sugar transport system ATP-binding protein
MAEVIVKGLTKKYGKVKAVDNLNLDIRDGELVVLLGPSGCGKTTTLRCIAGLEVPDTGEIWIGGRCVNNVPPKDRDIAMVFQSYALYPHMTVFENIAFPLKMRKTPKREINVRVKTVAEKLDIIELLGRKPAELSGGQQQRVALAAALVREPKVFLMDEPLSNIDAKLRIFMRTEIKKLQRELKITTIYVTHDQIEAMAIADRIGVMNHGKLQQFSSPDELYLNPENAFVAGFIGSPPMNMIEGDLVQLDEGVLVDAKLFTLKLPGTLNTLKALKSRRVLVGIRPEDIRVLREETESINFKAQVCGIEPLGVNTIVILEAGPVLLRAVVPGDLRFFAGEKVGVVLPQSRVYIFDGETGERVK